MKHLITRLTKLSVASILIVTLAACGGAEERKAAYLEKGLSYLADDNLDKAKVEIKNVLQIDPKFAEGYYAMGLLEDKKKELRKALGNYKKAIELKPDYTDAKIKLAKIYVIAGTEEYIKLAKNLLKEVDQTDSNNLEAKLISATIEYKVGDKVKARADLERILKQDDTLVEGISLLSSIYLYEGEEVKATELLEKGAISNVKNIPLRITVAKLLAKNNEFEKAEKYLRQAIEIKPERYSLQVALSTFFASINQLDKSEAVLRKAIEQDDEDAQRYLVLVELLSSRFSLAKGDEELKVAISKKPELYALKFAQIKFYDKTNRRGDAIKALKEIVRDKSYEVEGVNARNLLAKYLLENGDPKAAQQYVDEVLAEYPNNNEALIITSRLSLSNLDAITAINGLRTVIKNDPKNAQASLLLAQAHELNNESSLAENELKKSIEANPVNDQVHVNFARYLASKGRIDEAVSVVDKALAYFKESYDLMSMKLKVIGSQKGKEAEVLALLEMMEQTHSNKAEVNMIKGQYFISKGDSVNAIKEYEKAYEKSQDKYKPLQLVIRTYITNKKIKEAIQRLQRNLDKNPNDAIASLLLGQVYLVQKKVDQARKQFVHASLSAQGWLVPYTNLAATYLADKNYNQALIEYKNALNKVKNVAPIYMQIAAIHEKQKHYDKAIETYRLILAENEKNKLAANNLSSLLLDFGNETDAAQALVLSQGFEKIPQPALQDTLGWAYAKTGDNAKAVKVLKPIVEKAPKIAVFRYHLGYALYQTGDKAAAKSHLEIAVASDQQFIGKDKAEALLKSI